jgi:prevent-host-death family protein
MAETVNMHEAKSRLSQLVAKAEAGEEVIIARAGKPAVRLVPVAPAKSKPRKPGLWKGKGWIAPHFDETPEWLIDAFEGNLKDNG